MILKFLKSGHPYLKVVFLVFSFLFFSISIKNQSLDWGIFLNDPLNHFVNGNEKNWSFILVFVCFLITSLNCIGINNIAHEKKVIRKESILVAYIFLLITTPFTDFYYSIKMMTISFALLFFLKNLLSLYKNIRPFGIIYNAGIIISCISFLFPNIILLLGLILVGIIIFQKISWRKILISLTALITPYCSIWSYQYLTNSKMYFPKIIFEFQFQFLDLIPPHFGVIHFWMLMLGIISVLSFIELFMWSSKKSVRSRVSFHCITAYLIITLMIFLLSSETHTFYLVTTPLSVIVANYFIYSKHKKINEVLFFLFVFSSILYRLSIY